MTQATPGGVGKAPERDALIDALKFFAIALVVLGHVLSLPRFLHVAGPVYYALAAFEMPLFAALSGFVLFGREGASPVRFLWKKFLVLMVPYFSWTLIRMVVERTPPSQWTWYLYVLFLFYFLFAAIRALSKRDIALVVAALAVAALFVVPGGDLFVRLNIQRLFPYFIGGYLWAKHRPQLARVQGVAVAVVSGVAFALLVWFDYNGSTQPPHWYTMPLREAVATRPIPVIYFLGAVSIYLLAISGVVCSWASFSLLPQRLLRVLAVPGRASLGIYVVHSWLLAFPLGVGVGGVVLTWGFVVAGSWLATLAIQRVPVARELLLGQWRALPRG